MNLFFAWRYFNSKKSTTAINVIAWISIVAMTFGTAALILVLSVFNGFEGLVKSLYSSFYTDLKIFPAQGKVLSLTQDQLNKLKGFSGVENYSLIAEEKALLQNGEQQSIVSLKGVDENYQYVSGVAKSIIRGTFKLGDAENAKIVLGAGIENAIGVQSDRNLFPLVIHIPKRTTGNNLQLNSNIASGVLNSSGTFAIQQDFDNKYAITNLAFVKGMMGMTTHEYSAVEIAITDETNADEIKINIAQFLGKEYLVQTRFEQNRNLYSIMQAEKWVIFAVLCLILIVAAFNIIGALTMLVLEKEKDISVLYALGGSTNFIQKIFLSTGMLLAVIGGAMGMLLATAVAWLQVEYKLIPLQGGSFLINYFPVQLKLSDYLLVGISVIVIALLASWIPSRKAALQKFSLRSE